MQGAELAFPREVVRASCEGGLLPEADAATALQMVTDRNLAVHTYAEALAAELAQRLPRHLEVLERWVAGLGARI